MLTTNGHKSHARKRPPAGNNHPNAPPEVIKLGAKHRYAIQATMILKRLQDFVKVDPDRPKPTDIRLTRTQVHVALALLKKVLPDLASVEHVGNAEKPLMVQVVRFSDGATTVPMAVEARNMLDMGKLVELDASYTVNGSESGDEVGERKTRSPKK
jgi:hypothetical protein